MEKNEELREEMIRRGWTITTGEEIVIVTKQQGGTLVRMEEKFRTQAAYTASLESLVIHTKNSDEQFKKG